jgi:hypothetical protein
MAILRLSGLLTSMVGVLGGSYFSQKKGSTTINRSPAKLNRVSAGRTAMQTQQNNFSIVAKTWSTISDSARLAWQSAAGTQTFYNKANLPYTPSGYEYYCYCNGSVQAFGGTLLTEPQNPLPSIDVNRIEYGFDNTPGSLTIDLIGSITSGTKICNTFASAPNSAGATRPRGGYKLIGSHYLTTGFSNNLDAAYASVFGYNPSEGVIFLKYELVDQGSGIQEGVKLTKADSGFA